MYFIWNLKWVVLCVCIWVFIHSLAINNKSLKCLKFLLLGDSLGGNMGRTGDSMAHRHMAHSMVHNMGHNTAHSILVGNKQEGSKTCLFFFYLLSKNFTKNFESLGRNNVWYKLCGIILWLGKTHLVVWKSARGQYLP